MKSKRGFIAYLSTYLPRKCGIAIFTQDLSTNVEKLGLQPKIIALNDNGNTYDYSDKVLYQIQDKCPEDYVKVAQQINENDDIALVSIQHEFKIFGSDYGENLLFFLKKIRKPVVTTFHTVLPGPSEERKKIIQSIANYSEYIVVMTQSGVDILRDDYKIDEAKIKIIPHGIHELPYEESRFAKERLGYADKIILTSFGLLRSGRARASSGKGHEYVLDALLDVVKQFPNLLYLIIGATHPKYLKLEGERYREFLEAKVKELGLENNVQFINKYVTNDELFQYLQSSDLYICSPLNENQITSGTLVYAMGCGRAVVSTPFLHAKDIVSNERGLLSEFKNSASFTDAILKIISNPMLKENMEKNAYAYTRQMTWPNVALSYLELFNILETPEIKVEVLPEIALSQVNGNGSNGFRSGLINSRPKIPVLASPIKNKLKNGETRQTKAIILAGGLGTRLRPLTDTTPKPLLPVQDKPLIEHIIENLRNHGITEIILSIGYKAEQIKEYFGDGSRLGVQITYSIEDEPLGTGGAIRQAATGLIEPFFVVWGDNLMNIDCKEMVKAHTSQITMALTPREDVENFGVAKLEGEKVMNFVEKPKREEAPSNLINAGAFIIEPDCLNILPEGKSSIEKDCFEKLAPQGEITAYIHHGQWFPTDTMEKYTKAKEEFKKCIIIPN